MPTQSRHWEITQQLADSIKAGVPDVEGRVYVNRQRPLAQTDINGLVVRSIRSMPTLPAVLGGRTTWRYQINVECYVRGQGETGGALADALALAVSRHLATVDSLPGVSDLSLAQGADSLAWDYDQADQQLVCITLKYFVVHDTQTGEV